VSRISSPELEVDEDEDEDEDEIDVVVGTSGGFIVGEGAAGDE
jgi:hypothetical protein